MLKSLFKFKKTDSNSNKEFLVHSFFECITKNVPIKKQELNNVYKNFVAQKAFDMVSIAMSYTAINNYKEGARYYQTLNLLNDAKYLANSSNDLILFDSLSI